MTSDKRTSIALLLILVVTMAFMQYQKRKAEALQKQRAAQEAAQAAEVAEKGLDPEPDDPAPKPKDELGVDWSSPKPEPKPKPVRPTPAPKPEPKPEPGTTPPGAMEAAVGLDDPGEERRFTFKPAESPFEFVFTTRGGAVSSARLLDYPTSATDKSPLEVMRTEEELHATLAVAASDRGLPLPLDSVNYERLPTEGDNAIAFRRAFKAGVTVTKHFEAPAGKQHIALSVTFANTGDGARELQYRLTGGSRMVPEFFDGAGYLEGLIATSGTNGEAKVIRVKPGKLVDEKAGVATDPRSVESSRLLPVLWTGSVNKYFAALLRPLPALDEDSWIHEARIDGLPHTDAQARRDGTLGDPISNTVASFITHVFTVKPGESVTHRYLLYLGPKDRKLMDKVEAYRDFRGVVDYGWFEIFSNFLLMLLDLFYRVIPNYGVAIILLTLVVRLGLHPLQRKAQMSMRRMQKLQPEIKKLQEKHKGDKQRQSQEQMRLFREAGVNPMGGCLPMLFQLPIIIGLFRAIQLSVDLRCAPFVGWINDLSRPDTVTHIGGFALNILPIAMLASWIIQQATMPKPPDKQQAQQQRMMMIMTTVMFGWLFYSMASGVVLYWLTSTFVGILEQKQIKRSMAKMEAAEEAAAGKPKPGKA